MYCMLMNDQASGDALFDTFAMARHVAAVCVMNLGHTEGITDVYKV